MQSSKGKAVSVGIDFRSIKWRSHPQILFSIDLGEGDFDWALAIAYNSMLQAGRALMLKRGYRPMGEFKHVAVVEFVKVEFGDELSRRLVFAFNKIRRKRHRVVYEQAGATTEREASEVICLAKEFVNRVGDILKHKTGDGCI